MLYYWSFTLSMIAATVTYGEYCKLGAIGSRIIGGSDASIADLPYQLSLRYNGNHDCGASLISSSWVLSAAHCTYDREVYTISLLAGTDNRLSGGQVRGVAQIFEHPTFDPLTAENDITLLRPSTPFVLDFALRPIALPSPDDNWPDGSCSVVSGWGILQKSSNTAPLRLQRVTLPLVNQDLCNLVHRGKVSRGMLCAGFWRGGYDACQMDSGGPLAVDEKLVGIVSWGNECALPGLPGVYTRITSFRSWIAFVTGL